MQNNIDRYVNGFVGFNNPTLNRLFGEHNNRPDVLPCIGTQIGSLIYWLAKSVNAEKIIEFGTCLGYSAIILGEAVKENKGSVISIERAKNHYDEAQKNIIEARLGDYVTLIHGDSKEVFSNLDGPFDLILQDSQKALYPGMLEECIIKTRKGGIIIADDALFKPMGIAEKLSRPIDKYNKMVFSDPRLENTMIAVGDGITVSFVK
ncbi:MAG TPA: class I SAM-dependent methyltransferase [Victivallales bacterium]|nr:class I SAM-dependent methyltransferase [Victivallales bacterium]